MAKEELVTKRMSSVLLDGNTTLRLTLSSELKRLGVSPDDQVVISLIKTGNIKKIVIEKIKE